MLAARTLWQELGLDAILDRLEGSQKTFAATLADRALVLVAHRLATPGSEHGLTRFLEFDYVCSPIERRIIIAIIAFLIEHEEGHLNPTFCLARRLAARGHRLVYLVLADGSDFVRRQGFEVIPILEKAFPAGTIRTQRAIARAGEAPREEGKGGETTAAAPAGPSSQGAAASSGRSGSETTAARTRRKRSRRPRTLASSSTSRL